MNISQDLLHEYKVWTGWSEEDVKKTIKSLKCNHYDALNFFKCTTKFPNQEEQNLIKSFGFNEGFRKLITPKFQILENNMRTIR